MSILIRQKLIETANIKKIQMGHFEQFWNNVTNKVNSDTLIKALCSV